MPRISPNLLEIQRYPFHHAATTRYADMDWNQHINNVALSIALEDARFRFDKAAKVDEHMHGSRALLAACHIDYLSEAHYPDPLDSYVGVMEIGRTSWTLGSIIVQGTQVCAFAKTVTVCANEDGPVVLPDTLRNIFETRLIA